jgi:hypothetical protein
VFAEKITPSFVSARRAPEPRATLADFLVQKIREEAGA